MGVGEGSVCASVQNMGLEGAGGGGGGGEGGGAGGGGMTHKPSWTLCEQLVRS